MVEGCTPSPCLIHLAPQPRKPYFSSKEYRLSGRGLRIITPAPLNPKEYRLNGRGLRIITGMNEDDDGADSNGAGKTSLVAAPLWCLTGDMLARTEVRDGGRR